MLSHIVLFSFRPDVSSKKIEEILERARQDLSPIPGVMNLVAGVSIIPDTGFDYGITMNFENRKALADYREHPAHVKFRDEDFLPFVTKKQSLDFSDDQL